MKRYLLALGVLLSIAARAQGPMPPCISEAISAGREQAEDLLNRSDVEDLDNLLKSESANDIVWEISFVDKNHLNFTAFDVDLDKSSCQVRNIDSVPAPSNVSAPPISSASSEPCCDKCAVLNGYQCAPGLPACHQVGSCH